MSRERNGLSKESEVPGESGKEKTGSGRGAAGPDREADTAAILAPLADDPYEAVHPARKDHDL